MSVRHYFVLLAVALAAGGCDGREPRDLAACAKLVATGFRPVAAERTARFLGKMQEDTARCRGGDRAAAFRDLPWVDWQNYWATRDTRSRVRGLDWLLSPNERGIRGALFDLEHQRIELIKFNLFDNSGTYQEYVRGSKGVAGPALKVWDQMRLPKGYKETKNGPDRYESVGGDGKQICQGELIRFRTLTGICNDIRNPLMGSTNQPFARNVEFETTFPDLGKNEMAKNRHGGRLGTLKPDPQLISRKLFTRAQTEPDKCRAGQGLPGYSSDANCDYKKAPFFNVLAAFWIQFMTHDWFSHLKDGHNQEKTGKPVLMAVGCPDEVAKLGCRPGDRMDKAYVAEQSDPSPFTHQGKEYLSRAYKTTENTVTAWWDASQIYGYDGPSYGRVKRDPHDRAKLLLIPLSQRAGEGEKQGYLPKFDSVDESSAHFNSTWRGQEATAFPDNWSIGLSFFHNVFAREHNQFVDKFREQDPTKDSGLLDPTNPKRRPIRYGDVRPDELFEIARLVISAEIAKIHTIEWTTQLLYDEPLYQGMNANWHGLLREDGFVSEALEKIVVQNWGKSEDAKKANQWYSVFAAGPGIFGLGNSGCSSDKNIFEKDEHGGLKNPDCINGGTNHFGSPFNFPEEFVTVYRLHPLVPDLIEYREWDKDRNVILNKIPVVKTFRGDATDWMRENGLANWALSMGRQRLGLLTLQNHPQFLQNLPMPASRTGTGKLDVAALDIIRDRERGVPRFNEFRRQYGLKQLTSFDDFVDTKLDEKNPVQKAELKRQRETVKTLREVYSQHICDASKKPITSALSNDDKDNNDCLGRPDGSKVDNIEDLDTVVGWLAEPVRPHGFAISETQFQVFILNASRRLFSDRFFTSSFRPEFYTHFGVNWVNNNGPGEKEWEEKTSNGHKVEKSPLKRVLQRTIPELKEELEHVINAFDPWARDRGEYYSLQWKARPGAESDPAFQEPSGS